MSINHHFTNLKGEQQDLLVPVYVALSIVQEIVGRRVDYVHKLEVVTHVVRIHQQVQPQLIA